MSELVTGLKTPSRSEVKCAKGKILARIFADIRDCACWAN